MAAKKARKRAYIPPTVEVANRKERTTSAPRAQRTQAARGRAGGSKGQYAYPEPSFRRTAKRLPVYFALIFALQYWTYGKQNPGVSTTDQLIAAASLAGFITLLFAPFMHVMDRFAYNRYLRKTGQQASTDTKS